MRQFAYRVGIFCLAWIIGLVHNVYFDSEVVWIQKLYQEKIELAEAIKTSPRLLVVGGSGTHFGIDAQQIEREVNRPVINFGLHAGLGLNTILANLSGNLRPGDMVLLIPEYGILVGEGTGKFSSGFAAATQRPGLGGYGAKQTAQEMLMMGIPGSDRTIQMLKASIKRLLSPQQNTQLAGYGGTLDERGDPLKLPEGTAKPDRLEEQISEFAIRRLKAFEAEIKQNHATLIFALPWVYATLNSQSSNTVQQTIGNLTEIAPVLYGANYNLKTDLSLFGDTAYHLSEQGRNLRSLELAQQVRQFL
jgi:hypothetical protein